MGNCCIWWKICAEPTALGWVLFYDNGLKPVATKCFEPTALLKTNFVEVWNFVEA